MSDNKSKTGTIMITYEDGYYYVEFDNPDLEEEARTISKTLAHLVPQAVDEYEKASKAIEEKDMDTFQKYMSNFGQIIDVVSNRALEGRTQG